MEGNFRTILIILSTVIIGAIFIHGLWTIRKNRNPYKLKAGKEPIEPLTRGFDHSGFDQDGVSAARVIDGSALTGEIDNPPADEEIPHKPAPAPEFSADPIPKDLAEKNEAIADEIELAEDDIEDPTVESENVLNLDEIDIDTPVYDEPVTQAKPEAKKPVKRRISQAEKASLKRNQMEINFGDEAAAASQQQEVKPQLDPEVLVISVVMSQDQQMSGAALLPSLLTLGMKFGEMNIFHRHQDNAGNGKVTFSLANMVNPGTFDLDEMETFSTQGVTLFMTLPNEGNAFEVFEQMLSAAKQLAQEFNGQLLDDKRSVLTKQTEQHYTSKIREFERKSRIALA